MKPIKELMEMDKKDLKQILVDSDNRTEDVAEKKAEVDNLREDLAENREALAKAKEALKKAKANKLSIVERSIIQKIIDE